MQSLRAMTRLQHPTAGKIWISMIRAAVPVAQLEVRLIIIYHTQILTVVAGLRQAPPQRVLFQPDLSSSRQTRTATGHGQSPQPTTAPSMAYNGPSLPHSISSYEPRPPFPLTLRGVTTPANNSTRFYQQVNQQHIGLKRKAKNVTEPGCMTDLPVTKWVEKADMPQPALMAQTSTSGRYKR